MKPAVIYARVSSKDQEREGYSIPAQLKLLREYAHAHEFEVAQEFVDVETAKISGRKQFGAMVRFFRENRSCRTAIVEKRSGKTGVTAWCATGRKLSMAIPSS